MTVADFLNLRQWLIAVGFSVVPLAAAQAQLPSLVDNGVTMVEVLSSPAGETWTLVFSPSTGRSRVIASGRDWEIVAHTAANGSTA